VLVASGWPNTDLALELTSFVAHGSAWDTSAVGLGFDPMQMLRLPSKVRLAGEEAFAEALAAGRAFEAQRLALRAEALSAWADWALLGERLRAAGEDAALLESLERSARAALAAGGPQSALLERQVRLERARQALDGLRAEESAQRAALNALLAREPDAPLALPDAPPPPRARPAVAEILRAGVLENPELAGLAADVAVREAALGLAESRHTPDVAPFAEAGGGMDESLGLVITYPSNPSAVRAAIERARAERDAADATLRQARLDTRAALAAALAALDADERTAARLRDGVEPAARAAADAARSGYANGALSLADLVETQRALLELRVARAEAEASRERRLAAIERLVGTDLQRLVAPDAAPAVVALKEDP